MKYSKWLFILYAGCILKIVVSIIYFLGVFSDFYFFTITSIPVFLGMILYEDLIVLCVLGLIVSLLSWVASILFSLMGIRFAKMRYLSLFTITLATVIDLMASFMSPSIEVRITCGIASIIMLTICLKVALDHKKQLKCKN